jgi:hypothetical protein
MSRKILLTAALTVFTGIYAIGQSANQSSPVPANGPFGGPILVTPTATLPTPAPTAGISDTGRAGFNSMTTGSVAPVEPEAYSTSSVNASADTSSVSTATPNAEQPTNDLGPSVSINNGSGSAAPVAYTVVEASGRYKAGNAAHNARVLSNEDVESMLNKKGGVTMAKNMPPLGPGAIEQSGHLQNSGTQAGAQNPAQAGQQSPQSNTAANPGQNARETPPAASADQNAETSADNSTTPQINQNQQSNDAQGSRRLPATATFLPLFGLLGLASGGIGLWFRKFRK